MKLKNILSVICILVAMSSCSMEDDILNDNPSKLVPEEGSAYVSAVISMDGTQTKASTGSSSEPSKTNVTDAIKSCALFLLDSNNKVVWVHTETDEGSTATSKTINLLAKVNLAKRAVAVVNYDPKNEESLSECSDYADLESYMESDASYRLKMGKGSISWEGVNGSTSTTGDLEKVVVEIPLKSCTAIVELAEFKVNYKTERKPVVKLDSVRLSNLKTKGGWSEDEEGVADGSLNFDAKTYSLPRDTGNYSSSDNRLLADVYPNTKGEKHVTLTLIFSVKEGEYSETYTREYVINRPEEDGSFTNKSGHTYVMAGNWYRLKVKVNVSSDLVDCDIVCYTNDWIYDNSTFNGVEMTPAN